MKLNIVYYIMLAITGLVFTSCERDATNVAIPQIEPTLVVQCFISPQDSVTKAFVSMSSPVFSGTGNEEWVMDADVKITDGAITKQLALDLLAGGIFYKIDSSQFKIEAGKTYTLYVSTPNGKNAKATCTVPYPANTASLKAEWDTLYSFNATDGNITRTVKASIEWNDVAGSTNYYRAGTFAKTYVVNSPAKFFYEEMYNNLSDNDLVNDNNKDGSLLARRDLKTEVIETTGGLGGNFSYRVKGIRIYLLNCDENYYKYHLSASKNQYADDPFSEPVLVHSNILGGLGCFGASNQYITEIDF